ncbi:hypothetical protein TrVFT333_010054 [Trichoderma virens FT-333]|nr:hypothetical protein TrVFT333_010054 [Trichoderma virens FT-333]
MDHLFWDGRIRIAMEDYLYSKNTSLEEKQALLRYIETSPNFANPDPIINLEELDLRLTFITDLQRSYHKFTSSQRNNDGNFQFTTLQMSYLLLIPLGKLSDLVRNPMATIVPWLNLETYISFMVRGRILDNVSTGTRAVSQTPPSSSCSQLTDDTISICRNTDERDKCIARDNGACILTGAAFPDVCPILPFSINANDEGLAHYRTQHSLAMSLVDEKYLVNIPNLLGSGLGCSDKVWNMLCLHPTLRQWWEKCLFGLKCLRIIPSPKNGGKCTIQLQFHWMPRNGLDPQVYAQPDRDTFEKMLQIMSPQEEDLTTELRNPCSQRLKTGNVFSLIMPEEDATKMKGMIDIQWANVKLATISGAAGNWELLEHSPHEFDANPDPVVYWDDGWSRE